ncbi:MAG TPA: sigma-54 dependent transcriptional regulator [Bdellovibrionota bacterium]|nr:sigma-54 dependent transcriptional regulator [Bdellovibrionota bacterium]
MSKPPHILIVDDDKTIRASLGETLKDEGFRVSLAAGGNQAIKIIEQESVDMVLLDVWMQDIDGIETLKRLKELSPETPVIIMSGHGTVETAVKATKLGAYDFLEKPLSLEKLLVQIENLLRMNRLTEENRFLKAEVERRYQMIGESPVIQKLMETVRIVAPTQGWVLITGENGTGKELLARTIHRFSKRSDQPFIEVNCAAIPEELIESELFGHEKGAFTGATSQKKGKFELANGGTLFLDEIADMSLKTQSKILRILQEKTFERVGGVETLETDVRVIAATNKNLEEEIKQGRFREDLYYRLNVIPFHVPPLRERKSDIPLLVAHFLKTFAEENGRRPIVMSQDALKLLMAYQWPGNIRELKNIVERLVIMVPSQEIQEEDLLSVVKEFQTVPEGDPLENDSYRDACVAFEREFILRKLHLFNGNISKTAESIGIERSHLHRKIKALEIEI